MRNTGEKRCNEGGGWMGSPWAKKVEGEAGISKRTMRRNFKSLAAILRELRRGIVKEGIAETKKSWKPTSKATSR